MRNSQRNWNIIENRKQLYEKPFDFNPNPYETAFKPNRTIDTSSRKKKKSFERDNIRALSSGVAYNGISGKIFYQLQ